MLAVKNKSISLLWELNSFFIAVNSLRKNSIVLTLNMAALLHGCKPRIVDFSNHLDLQYILDGQVLLYTIPLFTTLTGYIIIFHTFDIPSSKMRWLLVDTRYIA